MVRKLLVVAALLIGLTGIAQAQQTFETRAAVSFNKHNYPTWYLVKQDSTSDTSWYMRDSAAIDTSAAYWTKPGWNVYTGFEASYSTDSVDAYIVMQIAMAQADEWEYYDSISITAADDMTFTKWGLDSMCARYFRFILYAIDAPFFNKVASTNDTATTVEIHHADSATWVITAAELTEATDYWNGGEIEWLMGNCSGQVETVTDFNATGDTVHFTACAACTLAVGDSFNVAIPHRDSGVVYTGKISARGD